MDIVTTSNPAHDAGLALTELLREQPATPTLLLVSGGSAFALLDYVDITALGEHITLTVLDERFTHIETDTNFHQLQKTAFYSHAVAQGVHVLPPFPTTTDTIDQAVNHFKTTLHHWQKNHPTGRILITVGVGIDGHTAGILPGTDAIDFDVADDVIGYEVSPTINPHTKRITVTNTFLRTKVHASIGYVVGQDKTKVLADLIRKDHAHTDIKAVILHDVHKLQIFTNVSY